MPWYGEKKQALQSKRMCQNIGRRGSDDKPCIFSGIKICLRKLSYDALQVRSARVGVGEARLPILWGNEDVSVNAAKQIGGTSHA